MALGPAWRADLANLAQLVRCVGKVRRAGRPPQMTSNSAEKGFSSVLPYQRLPWWRRRLVPRCTRPAGGSALDNLAALGFPVSEGTTPLTEDAAFADALTATTDDDGFTIVSRLADRFGALLGVPYTDRPAALDHSFVGSAMYHDTLRPWNTHPGQPRMGRGLLTSRGAAASARFSCRTYITNNCSSHQQTLRSHRVRGRENTDDHVQALGGQRSHSTHRASAWWARIKFSTPSINSVGRSGMAPTTTWPASLSLSATGTGHPAGL